MDRYLGTKIVLAEPADRDGRDGYMVVYEDGYTSWSPKETFERAYRRVTDAEMRLLENPDPPRAGSDAAGRAAPQ